MNYIEITGQPCSGKSTSINMSKSDDMTKFLKDDLYRKIFYFFLGIKFLGIQRSRVLFNWSFVEDASFIFKLNIFLNAVSKFGIFRTLETSSSDKAKRFLVDEGVSHIPFLFLKTETREVINFISSELQTINVYFMRSPRQDVIQSRLLSRGHKRLKFTLLSTFMSKTHEIEKVLLSQYPSLCKEFTVIEDVASI